MKEEHTKTDIRQKRRNKKRFAPVKHGTGIRERLHAKHLSRFLKSFIKKRLKIK